MGGGKIGSKVQVIPEQHWYETLSRFQMAHSGRRMSLQIEEIDGSQTALESRGRFELQLMGVSEAERGQPRRVRLVIHPDSGAEAETVQIDEPIAIRRQDGSLLIETAQGRRVLLQSYPA